MTMTGDGRNIEYVCDLPLTARHWYVALVASMEQIIGAALSTIVGIVMPMLNLFVHPQLSALIQGIMGASGLIGIAIGSAVIGPLSDRHGYLGWFRMSAVLIIVGSLISIITDHWAIICAGLLISGFGVGGGYSLDSAYISELMPTRWRNFMVGVAKASCAIGFLLPAVIALLILRCDASAHAWRYIFIIMCGMGVVTLLMRIHWAESPSWLLSQGRKADAEEAAHFFFGKNVSIRENAPGKVDSARPKASIGSLFKGRNLVRVVYSGIPWACEGLGVYGIGVFLPVMILALGLDKTSVTGIAKIINSVEMTAIVNFAILPGFVIGLLVVKKMNNAMMLWGGFLGAAIGLGVLLWAYLMHLPVWVSLAAFIFFEITLNGGPHLITYIIPAAIYPIDCRGAGGGISDFLGKLGAIVGVFVMPLMLSMGGMTLVLVVTIGIMILGAIISFICSSILGLNVGQKEKTENKED